MKIHIYISTFLFFFLPFCSFSQSVKIRGTVYSVNENTPINSATIRLKEDGITTMTDSLGQFVIQGLVNFSERKTLIISHAGFKTQSFSLSSGETKTYFLEQKVNELQEVIVSTGYQNVPKERITGSFVSIDNDLLNRSVSSDVLSRLEGVTSGLLFDRRVSGQPSISIRGQSTILSNASPLIVVDNFPYEGDINNINPDDIQQITVLKDAASASIWGTRASNGVIVITTKKGKLNTPLKISFNSNVTIESKPDLLKNPNFLNSSDFINVEREMFAKGYYDWMETDITYPMMSPVVELLMKHRGGSISDEELENNLSSLRKNDIRTDFKNHLFRQGLTHQYALNLSGGSDKTDYFISGGFNQHDQSQIGFKRQRATLNSSFNFRMSEKMQVGTSFSFANSINNNPNISYETFSNGIYPYARLMDENGTSGIISKDFNNQLKETAESDGLLDWYYRPLDELNTMRFKSNNIDFRSNNYIRYKVVNGLSLEARYQYQNQRTTNNNLYEQQSYYVRNLINQYAQKNTNNVYEFPIPVGAILDYGSSSIESHSGRLQGEYNHEWNKGSLNAIAGFELRQVNNTGNTSRVYGYDKDLITSQIVDYTTEYVTMPTWSSLRIPHGFNFTDLLDRNVSYYANAAYTYNSLYTISGSIRKDQSNLFGVNSNQKGVPLWSLGGSWLVSSERWYSIGNWLQFLKLRTTYGYNGNVNKALTAYATARYTRNSVTGFQQAQILTPANTDLRWEKIGIWNLGLDFGLRSGLVSGSVEYYRKKGIDLIGNAPLDPTIGFIVANQSRFIGNNADMAASGVDIQLNLHKNISNNIKWEAAILYNYNKDKITKYNFENSISSLLMSYPSPTVGYPRFSIFSYKWAGLDIEGDPQVYLPNGQISKDYSAILNSNDLAILEYNGPALPTQFGAVRNTFSYKDFSVGFNISYKFGHYFRRSSISYSGLYDSYMGHVDYAKRWMAAGDELITDVPSAPSDVSTSAIRDAVYLSSSRLVEKADHIRLQDINFGYNISLGNKRAYFNNLTIYGYINNVGIIWKANKSGIDPDFSLQSYPNPTTYAIGITLK